MLTVDVTGGAQDCTVRVDEYAAFDATGLAAAIAGGEVSAGEARDAALRAIERVDRQLHGVVAGPYADTTAAGDGAFSGVPFAVKDTLSERGRPLGFGTSLLEGFVARRDSTLAERFRAAGLVSLARTAMPEFAFNFDTAPRVHGAPATRGT